MNNILNIQNNKINKFKNYYKIHHYKFINKYYFIKHNSISNIYLKLNLDINYYIINNL